MIVRPAKAEDAAAIAVVHVRSWQGAYRGLLPQHFLDGLDAARRLAAWERSLAADDWPRSGALVAVDGADVIGFVHVLPSRDDDADPATVGEVSSIYVRPDVVGTGVGRSLMQGAIEALRSARYASATLWVLADNARAIAFYEAGGWRPDGTRKQDELAGVEITEARYRRALTD
ncbi:MAG: GNAT family N-acetyltransferase [Jatrophihabitantaceae bacterium]